VGLRVVSLPVTFPVSVHPLLSTACRSVVVLRVTTTWKLDAPYVAVPLLAALVQLLKVSVSLASCQVPTKGVAHGSILPAHAGAGVAFTQQRLAHWALVVHESAHTPPLPKLVQ